MVLIVLYIQPAEHWLFQMVTGVGVIGRIDLARARPRVPQ